MNNEEKKAMEYFKEKIGEFLIIKQRLEDNGKEIEKCDKEKINNYKIVLNLIEKQAKEIEDKKEEIYAIAKTNYILGQTDERSQWYKKIYKKLADLDKEEKEAQESISDEEREKYSDSNISYLLMNIETRREAIKELIGKEE